MKCAISPEAQRALRRKVAKAMLDMMVNKTPFDLKKLSASIYDFVYQAQEDHAQALDYARLVPVMVNQLQANDVEFAKLLHSSGTDLSELMGLVIGVSEDNGIQHMEDYLGVRDQETIKDELRVLNQPAENAVPETETETEDKYEPPPPPIQRVNPVESMDEDKRMQFYSSFQAVASTFLSDAILESPYIDWQGIARQGPKSRARVPYSHTAFYYGVKRKILEEMHKQGVSLDSDKLVLGPFQGIYLKAVRTSEVEPSEYSKASLQKDPEGVMLVLVDRYGVPISFTEDTFEPTVTGGRTAYFALRNTRTMVVDGVVKRSRLKAAAKALVTASGLTQEEAYAQLEKEVLHIHEIRTYVNNSPKQPLDDGGEMPLAPLQFKINGGSLGYITVRVTETTPLSKISDDLVFEVADETLAARQQDVQEGVTYVTSPTLYGQYLRVEKPDVQGSPYAELLVSLLTDPLVSDTKDPLTYEARRELVRSLLDIDKAEHIRIGSVKSDPYAHILTVGGKAQNLKTPEGVAAAKEAIRNLFAWQKKGTKVNGKPTHHVKLNIARDLVNKQIAIPEVNVVEDQNVVTTTKMDYVDFLTETGFSVATPDVSADGKLRRTNAYFTFELTSESDKTLNPEVETTEAPVSETVPQERSEEPLLEKDTDDLLDDLLNDPEAPLNKRLDQKNRNSAATRKQIRDAKEWYEKSPLSRYVPFKALFNLVNSDPGVVASWTFAGINLYQGSDYTDLYHESWHAFSQLFLTQAQKADLYSEVRGRSGGFTDHHGNRVRYSKATDLQLEEAIAEEFRTYMLRGQKSKKNAPKRNSLFRRIWNALKALFGKADRRDLILDPKSDSQLQQLFHNLRIGDIQNFTFNYQNAQFGRLNQGITPIKRLGNDPEQLNYGDSKLIVDMMDQFIAEFVDIKNTQLSRDQLWRKQELEKLLRNKTLTQTQRQRITTRLEAYDKRQTYKYTGTITKSKEMQQEAYRHAYERIGGKDGTGGLIGDLTEQIAGEENLTQKEMMIRDRATLIYAYVYFGNLDNISANHPKEGQTAKGTIAYHMLKTSVFLEPEIALDFENVSETETYTKSLRAFDRSGNESSLKELAKAEVLYLLRTLPKRNKNGDRVRNRFGVTELADFQASWNRLARSLANIQNFDLMYSTLQKEARNYPPFQDLIDRMGDPAHARAFEEVQLWTSFWQTFNKSRIPLIQATVNEETLKDGSVRYSARVGEAFNADYAVGRHWENEFSAAMPEENPYVLRDLEGSYLNAAKVLEDFTRQDATNNPFAFYNAIGFNLTDTAELRELLRKNSKQYTPIYFYNKIAELHKDKKLIRTLEEMTEGAESRYKSLQQLEARYSDQFSNFMVTNAEGNAQFEHSLNNTLSVMINSINQASSYSDLVNTPHMSYLDINNNPFAKASWWLKSMFRLDLDPSHPEYGARRIHQGRPVTLKLANLSGVLLKDINADMGEGVSSASADEFTKLIMDVHLSHAGTPELMRHADKGSSFSVTLDGPVLNNTSANQQYIPLESFRGKRYEEQIVDYLLPHLTAEVERILKMQELEADTTLTNYDFEYVKKGQRFAAFDNVLKSKTKDRILGSADPLAALESDLNLRAQIGKDIREYFDQQYESLNKKFSEASFLADNLVVDALEAGIPKSRATEAHLKSYVYNNWIHNIESISLLYGDLIQFNEVKEEFHKRNAGAGSTGTLYKTDSMMRNYINNTLWGSSYAAANAERLGITTPHQFTGRMNTAVTEDMNVLSAYTKEYQKAIGDKAKAYGTGNRGQNEADAQGLITFDAYRQLKVAEGSWSAAQELLFQKIVKGEKVPRNNVVKIFPVIKAQYWGPLADTQHLPIIGFHKYSLFPLIPTVIKGKNAEILHDKMVQENIGYLTFKSGSKVGRVTKEGSLDKLYEDEGRVLRGEIRDLNSQERYFTPNVIHLEFLKNQLEIHDSFKGKTIFPTQLRKLIEDGLMKNGVPTDFMPNEKDATRRINAWNNPRNDKNASKNYRLLKSYEKNISKLTQYAKDQLLEEINWTSEIVNGKEKLTGKMENLLRLVRRELTRQDLGQHSIDFIDVGADGRPKHDLSLSLSVEKIEKLLNALMVKRLVKQKVNGEALIQVATTLFEDANTNRVTPTNPTEEDLAKWGSNDLPFYRQKADGTTQAMKVKVALAGNFTHLLKLKHTDGGLIRTIERLNEMIKNEDWLNTARHRDMITMVGVRIPVQGLNSMEFMEVYEFLPIEAGPVIIPPTEIVTKSGADFDVDKMTVMMPNIKPAKVHRGTQVKEPTMWNWTEQEIQDEYDRYLLPIWLEHKDAAEIGLDELWESLGYDRGDIQSEVDEMVQDKIDTGEVLSYEKFKKRLLGSKGIQNDILKNIRDILELEQNFAPLITPNSTDLLDDVANEMKPHVMDYNPLTNMHGEDPRMSGDKKVISPTRVLEIQYNLYKHTSNNIGMQTLGLGAVDNTYNTLFNRIGAYMEPATVSPALYEKLKAKEKPSKEERKLMNKYVPQTILLPHNTLRVKSGTAISLSHLKDANGQNAISDVVNQLINGWVDIAKDAWIFNIQGNKEVSPVLLFMIQAGVPIKDAVYFVSNPLVREYIKYQKLAKSNFGGPLNTAHKNKNGQVNLNFFRAKAREKILTESKYGISVQKSSQDVVNNEIRKLLDRRQNFTTTELRERAKSHDGFNATDVDAFLHFLHLEDMTKSVRDLKMRTNVDTSRDVSLFEAQDRISMLEGLKADDRLPSNLVRKIQKDSPISSFFIQEFQILLLGDAFPLRNHPAINSFIQENVSFQEEKKTYGSRDATVINWKSDIINFIFQNELRYFDIDNQEFFKSRKLSKSKVLLKLGAAVEGDTFFYDPKTLRQQFTSRAYATPNYYNKLGLAPVSALAFENDQQYYQFVLERETLRVNKPLSSLKDSEKFKFKLNTITQSLKQPGMQFLRQKTGELKKEHTRRLVRFAYEQYLRDEALNKTFNHWHLFKSDNNYASEFMRIRETYPALVQSFELMNAVSMVGQVGFKNLKLNDASLDGDQINVLHENLHGKGTTPSLTNRPLLQEILPEASQQEIDEIVEYFENFPIVAFLQSGMNTKSSFALTPFVSQDKILQLIEEPVKNFMKLLETGSELSTKVLNAYHSAFLKNNSSSKRSSRIRGKNYSENVSFVQKQGLKSIALPSNLLVPETPSPFFLNEQSQMETFTYPRLSQAGAKDLVNANPDNVYVYNLAMVTPEKGNEKEDFVLHGAGPNAIGLASKHMYHKKRNMERSDIIRDVDGSVRPEVKEAIDHSIMQLREAASSGAKILFNTEGYGQDMVLKNKAGKFYAPQTFLYLSKVLYENFGYVNPRYLETKTGVGVVQTKQGITDEGLLQKRTVSDQAVEDFMKICGT